MRNNEDRLHLKIFYPDMVPEHELVEFNRTFELWNRIWVEMRSELNSKLATFSDNFSRQSEVLALYAEDRPIGTICHRYVDLAHKSTMYDSYFTPELCPEEVRAKLPTLGRTCVLGGHIFVDPDYRKKAAGLSIKNLLCSLSFAHLNATAPDIVVGMVRKDRGMHKVFYQSGAEALFSDTKWFDIPAEIVAFFPSKKPIIVDPAFLSLTEEIGSQCPKFRSNYFLRRNANERASAPFETPRLLRAG